MRNWTAAALIIGGFVWAGGGGYLDKPILAVIGVPAIIVGLILAYWDYLE